MRLSQSLHRLVGTFACAVMGLCAAGGLAWAWSARHQLPAQAFWVICGLAWGLLAAAGYALHLLYRSQTAEASARSQSRHIQAILDILPDGLGIYDANDRLVLMNSAYATLAGGPDAHITPGMHVEAVVHAAAHSGQFTQANPAPDAWRTERMAHYRVGDDTPALQSMVDDRWVHVSQRPLDGGGMVILRADVTEMVRKTRALEEALTSAERAQRMLHEAIEAMPVGLELYDEQDRLVLFNQQQARMCPHFALPDAIGQTYEALLRLGLQQGHPLEAHGQEELWLAHEMALHGHRQAPEARQYGPGLWMQLHESRTPSGLSVGVRLDITHLIEQRQKADAARQESQRSRQLLERAMQALPVGVEIFDEYDRLVLYNQQLARMYPQMDYPSLMGQPFAQLLRESIAAGHSPQAEGREEAWIAERLSEHGSDALSRLQKLSDGRWLTVYETRTPENYVLSVQLDITDLIIQRKDLEAAQQAAQTARNQLQDALEALPEGFVLFDANDRLVVCNTQFKRLYSIAAPMIQAGHTFEEIVRYGAERGQYLDAVGNEDEWVRNFVAAHRSASQATLQRLPNDRWVQVYESRTPDGGIAGVRTDVSLLVRKEQELAAANEQLARLSTTDGLTGLSNRRHFDERLQAEWQRGARRQQSLAVVLMDIDHFKNYNDLYGHIAGDECLRRVARVLQAHVRRADEIAARYGGEEFVLLLPGNTVTEALALAELCRKTLMALALPHAASATAPVVTLSIGVCAMVPVAQEKPSLLLQGADDALYRAKNAGRNRVEIAPTSP